jgi:hypothetical protein
MCEWRSPRLSSQSRRADQADRGLVDDGLLAADGPAAAAMVRTLEALSSR